MTGPLGPPAVDQQAASEPLPAPLAPAGRGHPAFHGLRVAGRLFGVVWANSRARIGIVLLSAFVFIAIFAPLISPYKLTDESFAPMRGPSAAHPLGTTNFGQDVLTQLLYGTRVSLGVALLVATLSTLIAVTVGLAMGYMRGLVDHALGFVTSVVLVIPVLPLIIVLATYLKGIPFMIFVLTITGWALGARVIRAQTGSLRSGDFVTLAQFSGERSPRIMFREIFPNMVSLVAATFFLSATYAVLGEVALEFLGLGNQDTVTWGTMLYWANNAQALTAGLWAWVLAPGLMIAILATSYSLINFGVDQLSNPRLRES
jgi:peptide/nickel transport system permease protein